MTRQRLVFRTDLETYTAEAQPIGNGGSGFVYLTTGSDGQRYAVKVLAPERATSTKLKRFANELYFGRKVRHDHIVPVLDSGTVELRSKQTPFFVMPHYSSSLRQMLSDGLEPDVALKLFDGIIAGLEFAHGRSVWHRDIKPENILYDKATDRLLLADFGIAHFEEDDLHTAEDRIGTRRQLRLRSTGTKEERG